MIRLHLKTPRHTDSQKTEYWDTMIDNLLKIIFPYVDLVQEDPALTILGNFKAQVTPPVMSC